MEEAYLLYSLLKESFLLLDNGDRQVFENYGLTVPRYYAMHHIALSPGISPSRLSTLMFCDKSNITRILHGLETDGFVVRRSHEQDGRVQRLFLTEQGITLHQRVSRDHEVTVEERLSAVVNRDQHGLTSILTYLNRSLSDRLQQPEAQFTTS